MSGFAILDMVAATSLGEHPGPLFDRLLNNECGARPIPAHRFDASFDSALNPLACVIDKDEAFWRDPQTHIVEEFLIAKIKQVKAGSKLADSIPAERIALCLGTSVGTGHELARAMRTSTPPRSTGGFGEMLAIAARQAGIGGPMSIVSTACTAGSSSIVRGVHYLMANRADMVICGGIDFFSELTYTGFNSLRAMTTDKCTPFDVDRKGMILGDGVGLLAIVRYEDAVRHGLPVLARASGFAIGSDNYHETAPQPDGSILTALMQKSWADAGEPAISYINAHGTGTPANDATEAVAFSRFAASTRQDEIRVSSVKGNLGHTLGAAGAVEAIVTVIALNRRMAPPNYSLCNPIAAAGLRFLQQYEALEEGTAAISVSLAFGGHICVLLLEANRRVGT